MNSNLKNNNYFEELYIKFEKKQKYYISFFNFFSNY